MTRLSKSTHFYPLMEPLMRSISTDLLLNRIWAILDSNRPLDQPNQLALPLRGVRIECNVVALFMLTQRDTKRLGLG